MFPWVFTVLYIQRIQIFKQIHTIYTSNVHTFPLNFHYFVLSTKSNFSTSLDYLYILCTPSRFGTFIDFPSIFLEFLHSTNLNFFTNSNFLRHLPLGDLYESFIFLSWSLSIIQMVTYLKNHKNHLSAIIAPMLKTVYVENSEKILWQNSEHFYFMQKNNFVDAVSKFEYTINTMCRKKILLM